MGRNKKKILAADLFCGAGGTSTGMMEAARELGLTVELTAINHWEVAVATHEENHKEATHLCMAIDHVNPEHLIPGKYLNLLVASPECTHHSIARGGKPRSEQKRADAWLLMRWIEKLYIENLLIENVKEFMDWGPLGRDGMPVKSKKGAFFKLFIEALKKTGYTVEHKILNCADYGDPQTRKRFFLIARRGRKKIVWPTPTHAKLAEIKKVGVATSIKPWRAAREIIDWTLKGESIYGRKKSLSDNTLRRIYAGFFKYSLKPLRDSTDLSPFILNCQGTDRRDRSIDEPLQTILGSNHKYLIEPFLVQFFTERNGGAPRVRSIDEPLSTITAGGIRQGLCYPYLINLAHNGAECDLKRNERYCYDADGPLPTLTGKGSHCLIEPYLVRYNTGSDAVSINQPLSTITANYEHLALVEPFVLPDVAPPSDGISLQPYLIRFNNNQGPQSIDDPLKTLSTKDRYALVIPQLGIALDFLFRMLQPHELAAGTSFPKSYIFTGTKKDVVKQIGNAVPVNTAKALCKAILGS